MLPQIPTSSLPVQNPYPSGMSFPQNLAASLDPETSVKLVRYLYSEYLLPQMMERRAYEPMWDRLLQMYKVKMKQDNMPFPESGSTEGDIKDRQFDNTKGRGSDRAQVSDSLIYDAVDRLKNINHFISWKDGTPIKYQPPRDINVAKEDEYYGPTAMKFKSYNGLLDWNIKNQEVYRKHLILAQHQYLYGISVVNSEFEFESQVIQRQNNAGQMIQQPEIMKIGTTFSPISLRRLWLNWRLPISEMDNQPCPFFYESMPRFAILQNSYDPQNNPFGYVNLDKLQSGQWMFSAPEMESARAAYAERLDASGCSSLSELIKPERSLEGLWTFYPMLPLDPATGEFDKRADGQTQVPFKRFILQAFASKLFAGDITPIRIQENFYPRNSIPLYGSAHMPDLDSGLYSPAIGEILENHYAEICTATNQFLDNKNLINDPPSFAVIGSPAINVDRNKAGATMIVNSVNDVGWRQVYDGTSQTVEFIKFLREQGQTSSKAVDAILGKALGSRTSATEATNVFQAAMSGVTTDINIFNYDIMGGYATRVWEYSGLWFNKDILRAITGQYGAELTPEDLWIRVDLKWDVGSTFIESIVKQQNLRYAISAAVSSPVLDQATLWRELFKEFRMPEAQAAVRDGDFTREVAIATEQAIDTYMGEQVITDPTQNHQIAIEVKIRFLKDTDSKWNKQYGALPAPIPNIKGQPQSRAQYLTEQIAMHQQFALMQMQQQLAQQQLAVHQQEAASVGGLKPIPAPAQGTEEMKNTSGNPHSPGGMMQQHMPATVNGQ